MTELVYPGTSAPATIKKVENWETALQFLVSETHSLSSKLEIMKPYPCSNCLRSHTAPSRLASAKTACPASYTLTAMELGAGHCDPTTESPTPAHHACLQGTEATTVLLHAHICLPNVPQMHLIDQT